jgi:molybdopterin synthase catalytic subunit
MDEDALAPQQGGTADSVVISCIEYEFLSGAHQRMDRLEERLPIWKHSLLHKLKYSRPF